MELLKIGAISEQGPLLKINEDNCDFDFETELYILIDAYGGVGVGDTLSNVLVEKIKKYFKNFVSDRNSTLPLFYSARYLLEANCLINAVLKVHKEVYAENLTKDFGKRAGASVSVIIQNDSVLNIFSTGNCRNYLVRNGQIGQIGDDDSFSFLSEDSSIPLSGIGLYENLEFKIKEVRLQKHDTIISLTDGVYGKLDKQEILGKSLLQDANPKIKIRELFQLANSKGNVDNQSAIILEY